MPAMGERHVPIATNAINECARMEANLPLITDAIQYRTQLRVIVNQLLSFTYEIDCDYDDMDRWREFRDLSRKRDAIRQALERGDAEPKTRPVRKTYYRDAEGRMAVTLECPGAPRQEVLVEDSQWAAKQLFAEADLVNNRRAIGLLSGFHGELHIFLDWGGIWDSRTGFQFVLPRFAARDFQRHLDEAEGKIARRYVDHIPAHALPAPTVEGAFERFLAADAGSSSADTVGSSTGEDGDDPGDDDA